MNVSSETGAFFIVNFIGSEMNETRIDEVANVMLNIESSGIDKVFKLFEKLNEQNFPKHIIAILSRMPSLSLATGCPDGTNPIIKLHVLSFGTSITIPVLENIYNSKNLAKKERLLGSIMCPSTSKARNKNILEIYKQLIQTKKASFAAKLAGWVSSEVFEGKGKVVRQLFQDLTPAESGQIMRNLSPDILDVFLLVRGLSSEFAKSFESLVEIDETAWVANTFKRMHEKVKEKTLAPRRIAMMAEAPRNKLLAALNEKGLDIVDKVASEVAKQPKEKKRKGFFSIFSRQK